MFHTGRIKNTYCNNLIFFLICSFSLASSILYLIWASLQNSYWNNKYDMEEELNYHTCNDINNLYTNNTEYEKYLIGWVVKEYCSNNSFICNFDGINCYVKHDFKMGGITALFFLAVLDASFHILLFLANSIREYDLCCTKLNFDMYKIRYNRENNILVDLSDEKYIELYMISRYGKDYTKEELKELDSIDINLNIHEKIRSMSYHSYSTILCTSVTHIIGLIINSGFYGWLKYTYSIGDHLEYGLYSVIGRIMTPILYLIFILLTDDSIRKYNYDNCCFNKCIKSIHFHFMECFQGCSDCMNAYFCGMLKECDCSRNIKTTTTITQNNVEILNNNIKMINNYV